MQFVTTTNGRRDEMCKRLITTISLVVALATFGAASTATAEPNNTTPTSPGACNMLHTNEQGLIGMMNDRHVYDIMIPLVLASLDAGCTPG
jgi:hypothetical protein